LEELYHIDPSINVPIYQQLVQSIRANIKNGKLQKGTRLPTVRELSDSLQVARGTVKRTYDELEAEGLIKKVQGNGTFVCFEQPRAENRKDKAMAAIDRALSEMEHMGFSLSEINIFLNLKLRELASHQEKIKVALVECNGEILNQISSQLRKRENIDIYTTLLSEMEAYPYGISEEMDVIVTTQSHAEAVERLISDKKKLCKIALRLSSKTVKQIVKLSPGEKVGILCASLRFGNLIAGACRSFTDNVKIEGPAVIEAGFDMASFLQGKTAVLVPQNYERYCSLDARARLQKFAGESKLITCHYHIDEGSFMYLEEKIDRLLEQKTI